LQAALDLRLSLVTRTPRRATCATRPFSLSAMAELDLAEGDPAAAEPLIADAVATGAQLAGAAPGDVLHAARSLDRPEHPCLDPDAAQPQQRGGRGREGLAGNRRPAVCNSRRTIPSICTTGWSR
jgi:hypothetical protein